MRARHLCLALLFTLLACVGCNKPADPDAPLAFAPADTPYLFTNLEPLSDEAFAAWQAQTRVVWPQMRETLQQAMATVAGAEPDGVGTKALQVIVEEIFSDEDPNAWMRRAGLSQKARMAFYGVELWPVLRMELADPAAFDAWVTRIEGRLGVAFDKADIAGLAVRTFGDANARAVIAIQGQHLVAAITPGDADVAMQRRVLGIDRPARAFDVATLRQFNEANGYLPIGSGWLDTRRLASIALRHAEDYADPACKAEVESIAAKVPRFGFGYRTFEARRMALHARIELEPALAKSLSALPMPLPGAADANALLDVAMTLPALRTRDFLRAQADAVVAAPYACGGLAWLNQSARETKTSLAQTLPPPVRDFTGVRIVLDQLEWAEGEDALPDARGRLVLGTGNPEFITSLAQVSMPALAGLSIPDDGRPVAIPAAALPPMAARYDLQVAMSGNALGIAAGKDQADRLTAAVTTSGAADGTLFTWSMRGALYASLAEALGRFGAKMPQELRDQFDAQRRMYVFYAKWIERVDVRGWLSADGFEIEEDIRLGTP